MADMHAREALRSKEAELAAQTVVDGKRQLLADAVKTANEVQASVDDPIETSVRKAEATTRVRWASPQARVVDM